MKLLLLIFMITSLIGYRPLHPPQLMNEKEQEFFSLDSYLILDEVSERNLSAYLVTERTDQAEQYWNSFSDPQVRKEAFTCLETGYAYDEYLFPLKLVLLEEGRLESHSEFTPRETLSAPFTCFSLESISNKEQLRVKTRSADGLTQNEKYYIWNLKLDLLTEE